MSFFSCGLGGALHPTPLDPCELAPDEDDRAVFVSKGGSEPSTVRGKGLCIR